MIRTSLTATALALTLAGSASAASMSVLPLNDDNAYQAPDNLVVDLLRTDSRSGSYHERDVKDNRDNAQSFTMTQATIIDKIAINYITLQLTETDMTTFEFFRVADPNASSVLPDGGIIDSISFNGSHAAFDDGEGGTYTSGTLIFDVTDTMAAAGDTFAIRFNTDSGDGFTIKWKYFDNYASSYDGGKAYENNNASSTKVYAFGVTAVPEPASLALLGLGGLAMLGRQRTGRHRA